MQGEIELGIQIKFPTIEYQNSNKNFSVVKTLSFDEIHKIFDDDGLMDDWQFNAINIFTNN